MRALAITGMETHAWISRIFVGSAMRATPPWARMSDGTRSSAMTAQAPASSAIFACSALVTSMMTPPLSMSARPLFTRMVPVSLTRTTSLSRRGQSRLLDSLRAVAAQLFAASSFSALAWSMIFCAMCAGTSSYRRNSMW